jgi:REP element-mobilizing transposase RayT
VVFVDRVYNLHHLVHFVVCLYGLDELLFAERYQRNLLSEPLVVSQVTHFISWLVKPNHICVVYLVVQVPKDLGILDVVNAADVKSFTLSSAFFAWKSEQQFILLL